MNLLVSVSAPRALALRIISQPVPPPVAVTGLIDTGASISCIDPSVRQALGLTPVGTIQIQVPATGPVPYTCNLFKIDLAVVHPLGNPRWNLVRNLLTVAEAHVSHLGTDVLVGCDVLAGCQFIYDGPGDHFSLTY